MNMEPENGEISGSRSLSTYITLLRPLNAVMAGVGVFVGGIVAMGTDITGADVLFRVILAYFAAFFATGAGNALNDIVDAETDKVNHPERPIPSGKLTPDQVRLVVYAGYGLTFLLSAFVNILNFIIAFINISLMVAYEMRLKKMGFVGNLTISYLTGSVFIFGGSATLENAGIIDMATSSEFGVTVILAFLAFLVSVGREIIKDIQDMEGDTDRFTLPMKIGKQKAGLLAAGMIIIAVAFSWLPVHFDILGSTYLAIVLPADALFVYAALTGSANPARAQKLAKFAMLGALMAFMIGAIA
jgi:geranylgeranylglycerol-phosphate geranylgeranyltransferase